MSELIMDDVQIYTRNEVFKSTIKYFDGDELATNAWINKYCLKDSDGNLFEMNPDDMHHRLARELHRIEQKYPNPLDYDTIYELLKGFKYIVPQGGPMAGIGNNRQVSSISNCFVAGNNIDSYGGILRTDEEIVQIAKMRGGGGIDISHIRPSGSHVNNSAMTSTGIVPFMERFSNSTREVSQKSRRGALLQSISIKHPEAENFINAKMEEGKITGSNISVKITDEFMNAVIEDKPYTQQFPVDAKKPKITKDVDPRKLWDKIMHNAWKSAEPGVLFWDQIIKESPADCYKTDGFTTVSTNPCFPDYTTVQSKTKGEITIKELEIGDEIWSMEGWTKVINKIYSGVKSVNDYHTTSITIPLTENHKVLTKNGTEKIEVKDAKELEYLSTSIITETILNIVPLGEMDVWDITVDNTSHSFMLNHCNVGNCGELPLALHSSCILALLNSTTYVTNPYTPKAKLNKELLSEHSKYIMRIMDDIVDLEIEKVDQIIEKIVNDPEPEEIKRSELNLWRNIRHMTISGRRTGVGITGEGDMLASLGITYGSEESIEFMKEFHKILATNVYISSIELAKDRGCFEVWDKEKEKDNPFLNRVLFNNDMVSEDVLKMYNEYGRRNIACLTLSPAGTVSLMTQTTSGIEPAFAIKYTRKRKVNPNDSGVDTSLIEYDKVGDAWEKYYVYHHGFLRWAKIHKINLENLTDEEYQEQYEKSPYYKSTSADIDWVNKVRLQGEVQKWIDHSISVTVNLPNDVTEQLVSDVYMEAWRCGCKGLTIYREGSRDGVLISDKQKQSNESLFKEVTAPKRPKNLEADVIRFNNKGEKWVGVLGLLDGKPYELFTGKLDSFNIPASIDKGVIIKIKEHGDSRYDFQYTDNEGYKTTMEGLNRAFNREYHNYARLISGILRHGMPLTNVYELVDNLRLEDGDSITDWKSGVKRMIKKYIKDGSRSKESCTDCGTELIFESGCKKCPQCGWSKCD